MTKTRQTFGDRMAVLKNARHERFAQAVASGETQDAAYKIAGYKPSRGNASTLRSNQNVEARIVQLQATGARAAGVTVESVTEHLMRIATKAEALEDSAGLGVARLAMMDTAKLAGIVTDKVQADITERAQVPTRAQIEARRAQWDRDVTERTDARLN